MAKFTALQTITEAPHSVTLRLPMVAGQSTNVSEDEAVVLRGLTDLFAEEPTWKPTAPLNRMVAAAEIAKAEDVDEPEE